MVISVGIDVSKDKHDCFIVSSEGEVLADVFTIPNNMDGFHRLLQRIQDCTNSQDKIKVGLEATGHYSYNLLGFLLDNGLTTYVLNPLRTNLYRKSLSLRKTKTDRVDARTIASMLLSDAGLKPYTNIAYHNEELKSLTRYRFDKVKERAKLKSSISRLVCILFPELEKLVPTLHMTSVYSLLEELPGAKQVAAAHLTRLKTLLETASKGHYKRDMALEIRDAARNSIGSRMPAKSLELQHTIRLTRELDREIDEIEEQIQSIMGELHSPITTIPGLGFRMAAMILAEVGDFTRFDSPDKLLAYAGMSPSTYQSGQQAYSSSLVYGVTKSAIHFLTKSLVKELEPKQIRVNAIAPGFIETSWHKNRTPESYERINRKIALHRFGEISEVADMAYEILKNGYMNGSIVDIHGGYDYF